MTWGFSNSTGGLLGRTDTVQDIDPPKPVAKPTDEKEVPHKLEREGAQSVVR